MKDKIFKSFGFHKHICQVKKVCLADEQRRCERKK